MTAPLPTSEFNDDALHEQERRRRQREINQPLIDLLDSWAEASEEEIAEQRETWELLQQALREDRIIFRIPKL